MIASLSFSLLFVVWAQAFDLTCAPLIDLTVYHGASLALVCEQVERPMALAHRYECINRLAHAVGTQPQAAMPMFQYLLEGPGLLACLESPESANLKVNTGSRDNFHEPRPIADAVKLQAML
jgi:hypothetical protein